MRVVVVGAGIGGLAAAVALRKIGIETLLIERAASIREVGAGLSIWSNAIHALRELGLEDKVMASASVIDRPLVQSSKGRFIARTEFSELTRMAGASSVCLHRGALQKTLLEALLRIRCEAVPAAPAWKVQLRSWRAHCEHAWAERGLG